LTILLRVCDEEDDSDGEASANWRDAKTHSAMRRKIERAIVPGYEILDLREEGEEGNGAGFRRRRVGLSIPKEVSEEPNRVLKPKHKTSHSRRLLKRGECPVPAR
jgi:hypothetical protein